LALKANLSQQSLFEDAASICKGSFPPKLAETYRIVFSASNGDSSAQGMPRESKLLSLELPENWDGSKYVFETFLWHL
jgi:hypothetical protein